MSDPFVDAKVGTALEESLIQALPSHIMKF